MSKYYFSYGSNMHPRQMQQRCPASEFVENLEFIGWRFAFSPVHTGANIYYTGNKGDRIWGCVYKITEQCEMVLDECEGIVEGYYKKTSIQHDKYSGHDMLLYVVDGCIGQGLPYMDYHARIVQALEQRGICTVYTDEVNSIGHLGINFPERNYQGDADGRER